MNETEYITGQDSGRDLNFITEVEDSEVNDVSERINYCLNDLEMIVFKGQKCAIRMQSGSVAVLGSYDELQPLLDNAGSDISVRVSIFPDAKISPELFLKFNRYISNIPYPVLHGFLNQSRVQVFSFTLYHWDEMRRVDRRFGCESNLFTKSNTSELYYLGGHKHVETYEEAAAIWDSVLSLVGISNNRLIKKHRSSLSVAFKNSSMDSQINSFHADTLRYGSALIGKLLQYLTYTTKKPEYREYLNLIMEDVSPDKVFRAEGFRDILYAKYYYLSKIGGRWAFQS